MLARIVTDTLQPAVFDIGQNKDIDGIKIDFLPTECIQNSDSYLEQMINEFTQKVRKDIELEKAKTSPRYKGYR